MSTASALAEFFTERLSAINGGGSYETSIGANVMRGRRDVALDAIPCCVIFEGEDKPKDQTKREYEVIIEQYYGVEGFMEAEDINNPNDTAHKIISDIKRAIFLRDLTFPKNFRNLTYRGRSIGVRLDGSTVVSAIVLFSVEYTETLSAP
jgi:hypothetical protein